MSANARLPDFLSEFEMGFSSLVEMIDGTISKRKKSIKLRQQIARISVAKRIQIKKIERDKFQRIYGNKIQVVYQKKMEDLKKVYEINRLW